MSNTLIDDKQIKRDTVGKIALDLQQKTPDTNDPIELQREMQKDFERNVLECVERGKKLFSGDFFVVVETKKERLFQNVLRNYFIPRETCPTPTYDNAVYHYKKFTDSLEFLWVIPSKDTCELFLNNVLHIPEDQKELLNYIIDFANGTLFQKAKKLNKEKADSIFLEK